MTTIIDLSIVEAYEHANICTTVNDRGIRTCDTTYTEDRTNKERASMDEVRGGEVKAKVNSLLQSLYPDAKPLDLGMSRLKDL